MQSFFRGALEELRGRRMEQKELIRYLRETQNSMEMEGLLSKREFCRVQEGDILRASTTSVDNVPLFCRISAVIIAAACSDAARVVKM